MNLHRSTYADGALVSKDGSPAEPKPCAGNDGTTLTAGSPTPDLSTPSGSSTKQAIGQTYGQTLAKDLLTVKVSSKEDDDGDEAMEDDEEEWSAEAHFSGPNYQAKKTVFLLFINQLTEILQKHVFVGIVDIDRCLSLIQHSTKLYLVNYGALSEELFYQLGLRQFGNYTRIKLDPPPPLRMLVRIAVEAEEGTKNSRLSKADIVNLIVDTIMTRSDMLKEYFLLTINKEGMVETLPSLLKGYTPNLDKLPLFLMRLGPQVNWNSESECFESFLRELAYFYVPEPLVPEEATSSPPAGKTKEQATRWQIEHLLFPVMRKYFAAPKTLLDRDVVQVAHLPELYRVFERC
ncbi:hypothetical protein PHLCEN_2v12717 [Hermanssonia centrifuga]|uniref:DNA mismatch repair protein Mlh1 C-terminal domain-containing protein n=1 Tax=Hermanssonia centrifuga TaxID=98765 RepID=A0A2R6NGE0_9APHY|nr:hypothetical protein PHLCEN_2v12717 [Hermanssonia centrifuga]